MGSPTRAQVRKRRRVGNALGVAAALVVAGALAALLTGFLVLYRDLGQANEARDALAKQVQALGGKPVAGPPGSRGEAGKTIVGKRGPSGAPGKAGQDGKDAPTITPAPGPTGPAGPSGAPGAQGEPGADSTVPGPAGATGPAGQDGASGAPGKDGTNGQDGKDAAPPATMTFTDADGTTRDCTLADGSDPDNPRYTCTAAGTSAPDPSPSTPDQQPQQQKPSGDGTASSGLLPLNLLERRRG